MFVVGLIMIVASAVCSVAAVRQTSRANPGVLIPLLKNPPTRSGRGTVFLVATALLVIWGGNLADDALGPWVFAILIVILIVPHFVMRTLHNRKVTAAA